MKMNVDMHTHTIYSGHCLTKLEDFRKICVKKNIYPIITDHNTIEGAVRYKKMYRDCVIGEEVSTKQGEIIGLFLSETIPSGLHIHEVVDNIRGQDGLVFLEHPFDRLRRRLDISYHNKIQIDIIEIFNSRTIFKNDNLRAREFAEKNGFLKGVGSDAHTGLEIGMSYASMDDFHSKEEFLRNLKSASFHVKRSPIYVHLITKYIKLRKSL